MRGKDIDAQIAQIKKWKAEGILSDPKVTKQIYHEECANQSDYELDKKDVKYVYQGGQILDGNTGKLAPPDVVKAIDERVKKIQPTRSTVGDDAIRKLESLTELRKV